MGFITPKGWTQTERQYKGFTLYMLSKKDKGIKCHCFKDGKEIFTQRFNFILPEKLYDRMAKRIDMYLSGEWTPIKVLKQGTTIDND